MDIQNVNIPVSYEAEQSVLGAVILKPECFGDLINLVAGDDFYVDEHREVFFAMHDLFAQSRNIDHVTVTETLVNKGVMDADRAKQVITRILTAVPSAANASDYARIVRDRAVRRNLMNICREIQESAASETDTADHLLEMAEKKIYGLSDKNITGNFRHIRDVIKDNYHHLKELSDNPEESAGMPTGFSAIDNLLVGMGTGDMVLVGARPGVGKTSFTMNIATKAARALGKTVCVFSLEMSAEQLVMRMLSSEAKIDSKILRSGRLQQENWQALAVAANTLSECNILIDDTAGMSVTKMKSRLRRIKNLGLVVIDYLQLMQAETKTDNRANEVGEISRGIKLMAKEFGVPVLTCAQLNRAVE
ncbi:MAG: replicative DNA helicase, partial [Ruminococcaceae bacterium]|nr:replicative DNA helicase [Oscillospiraceae bacterium]